MKILPSDNSYSTFCELISGYRRFQVITEAVNSGIIDLLENGENTLEQLLQATRMRPAEGQRFIDLLVAAGLLEESAGRLSLSLFSRSFLSRTSATSQRHTLEFEPLLMENWRQLGVVLHEGQGALIREHSPVEYQERLQLFQQAMAEAAEVRSRELWDALTLLPERGVIIDIGAGDGTYLREFLARHPEWQGIACDLPDVCMQIESSSIPKNLRLHPCNVMNRQDFADLVSDNRTVADLLLLSNICHCYSPEENSALLLQAGALLADGGLLIVHDFFRDVNDYSAMYDLHMLVNTYNGRSYTTAKTAAMLQGAGFSHYRIIELPSHSLTIVASRSRLSSCEGAPTGNRFSLRR